MQPELNYEIAQQLAQELIAKTQEIKRLSNDVDLLKLEIYDAARSGISGNGGRIVFIDAGTSLQFNRTRLHEQLVTILSITASQADEFIESCKTEVSKSAYIAVYLD
jgi:hypothetical protein